jgi:hypothetical protein
VASWASRSLTYGFCNSPLSFAGVGRSVLNCQALTPAGIHRLTLRLSSFVTSASTPPSGADISKVVRTDVGDSPCRLASARRRRFMKSVKYCGDRSLISSALIRKGMRVTVLAKT